MPCFPNPTRLVRPEITCCVSGQRKFVGVEIKEDVDKLLRDFSLPVVNFVDLRDLATEKLGEKAMKSAGLKTLPLRVLNKEIKNQRKLL